MAETITKTAPAPKTVTPIAPAPKTPAKIRFESRNPESSQFSVLGVRGMRKEGSRSSDEPLTVVWDVPADMVERFERHFFVATGRIRRA